MLICYIPVLDTAELTPKEVRHEHYWQRRAGKKLLAEKLEIPEDEIAYVDQSIHIPMSCLSTKHKDAHHLSMFVKKALSNAEYMVIPPNWEEDDFAITAVHCARYLGLKSLYLKVADEFIIWE